jgi:hypothetical protein
MYLRARSSPVVIPTEAVLTVGVVVFAVATVVMVVGLRKGVKAQGMGRVKMFAQPMLPWSLAGIGLCVVDLVWLFVAL